MISLIATVLNEGESIRQLLDSIIAQTRPPDEIVIVDGGSSDDTVAIMKGYSDRLPLQVIALPGCNISAGRNCAIRAARGDIIAVTDAGVRLKDTWLDEISAPLLRDSGIDVVAGFFRCRSAESLRAGFGGDHLALGARDQPGDLPAQQPQHRLPQVGRGEGWLVSRMARLLRRPDIRPAPESSGQLDSRSRPKRPPIFVRAPRRAVTSASISCTPAAMAKPSSGQRAISSVTRPICCWFRSSLRWGWRCIHFSGFCILQEAQSIYISPIAVCRL